MFSMQRRFKRSSSIGRIAMLAAVLAISENNASADDWPTYRHDMARSGITAEKLSLPLTESWVFEARDVPRPAWGDPKPVAVEEILELRRIHFDDVFQPVAADGAVFFGSSTDHKVYCLDATTGQIRWTKITGGPVRLAPTLADGRVYFGSDDGYAYCLNAKDGTARWTFHAAPEQQRLLGHGKMISLWPLRTGVLVDRGIAYLSAGIFPAEGVFLYAVDAADGTQLWRNDTCGETPQSKISPQGYLLASETSLYVPMGRVSPATFARSDGQLKQQSPFFGKTVGGTYALLAGEEMFTGTETMVGTRAGTRDQFATFAGRKMVVSGDTAYLAGDTFLRAMARRKETTPLAHWKLASRCADSLILAGDVLFAGGNGLVIGVDATSGKQLWQAEVDGTAKGLAVADGRLLVSTDTGKIYSFGSATATKHGRIVQTIQETPPSASMFAKAAQKILDETKIRRGYCLVLGLETGELALELAKRSQLMIYAVSPDADKVAAARKTIDAAGLYGARVCVEQWPLDGVPYADYFANLIVSETTTLTGQLPGEPSEIVRMLKPIGGTLMLGQPAGHTDGTKRLAVDTLRRSFSTSLDAPQSIAGDGTWFKATRGPLPGAGSWTHEYANPGNTACGDDQIVNAPLGVLWFGHPGPGDMVNRHQRAASPLSLDGRMFIEGENTVMAYDAYNGLKLWQRDIPGAMRVNASHDSSNLAVSRDGLFVAVGDKCHRLDPVTGQTLTTYVLPPADDSTPRLWGYVACSGGLLFGSRTTNRRDSDCVVAFDIESGKQRWLYKGKNIPHNAIAIGDQTVFVVDRNISDAQREKVLDEQRATIQSLPESQRSKAEQALADADIRTVVALSEATGELRWQKPVDLTHCGGWHAAHNKHSAIMATMYNEGVLVIFGVYLDGHYWEQFFAGQFDSRRITALSGNGGSQLWSRQIGFRVRPLIIGDTLHAEPWAFDLHSGEPRMRTNPITGLADRWQFSRVGHHCGLPIGSPNALFFRSYNLAYYDLAGDYGSLHFGAQRPGCWINFLPAAGLLMMPEASAGCMCAFPNMCTVVFKPVEKLKGWAMYSTPGGTLPVKRLGVNFGAAGDRKDAAGNLWLSYPRPFTGRLVLPLSIDASFHSGGHFVTENTVYADYGGTDDSWLFASAAQGLRKCEIPLLELGDGTAAYRVRLALADPKHDQPGRRVFDIKLQDKLVRENVDIVKAAGGGRRAIWIEFDAIEVDDKLAIELLPKGPSEGVDQLPILQGVEIIRQRMLTLGCQTPSFLLSQLDATQSGELKLANLCEMPFDGTLQIDVPEGFDVSLKQRPLRLASGERTTLPLSASVASDVPAGEYAIAVKLVRNDGSVEIARTATITHLGRRGRKVFEVVEDACARQRYPDQNQGAVGTSWVDGGASKMGDLDHALTYLKFRVDIPGKAVSVRLRLHNGGNPSGDSGRVCLTAGPWDEKSVTYDNRPAAGKELGRLGRVVEKQIVECPLNVDLSGKTELSLVLDPTSCDGIDYMMREGGQPAELIVEYEP